MTDVIKAAVFIPFLIAGGLAVAFLSYIMVPMFVALIIFGIVYVIVIDLKD
jgi:hypothetical protein